MAPACALRPEQQDYWRQLSIRKRQFAAFKTQHADVLALSKTNVLALPADVKEQREAPTPLQKQRAMLAEREPWLHMYGLSQEGKDPPGARHQEYLHELLNKKLEKYFPREAFIDKRDLAVELSVTFLVETAPGKFFEIQDRKEFPPLRDVLTGDALCVVRRKLVVSDRTPRIQALLLTDNRGVMKPEFLARIAQLAKEAFFNLHQELQTQLHEVTNDSEIENAYFTIVKNRLACALLPLLEEKEQTAVATLARRWMDNRDNGATGSAASGRREHLCARHCCAD
ncbi:hypothetical protein SGGMMB4_04591 [Sodalis glossinidius str. 'morsitans']|nr:hypothetical protein [Sodalis glossinidius]CRL46183.1 hypothetical protein SGGMMB4_04591 [Sodalis glossinidius str. 'morsitans']